MKTTMVHSRTSDERPSHAAPRLVAERSFRHGDIPAARQFARAFWVRARLSPARLADFVLAVSEATAAATGWGPGAARLRLWVTGTRAFCEVRGDRMPTRQASYGKTFRQGETEMLRRCVLQQLADYVSVASGPDGAWVLLSMTAS
jgi:hypothetical protein